MVCGYRQVFFLVALLCASWGGEWGGAYASNPEYIETEASQSQGVSASPMNHGFGTPVIFEHHRKRLANLPAFRREGHLDANIRSYWLYRDYSDAPLREAFSVGGEVLYVSGWYKDVLQLKAAAYTSQKLIGDNDKQGTGLLQPPQQGYSALGQLSANVRVGQSQVSLFRTELSTPFANKRDTRMTPYLFEQYALLFREVERLDVLAAWVTAYKPHTSQDFEPVLAGIDDKTDSDLAIFGARYKPAENISFGGVGYHVAEYIDIAYAELNWTPGWGGGGVEFAQQWIAQNSIGDEVGGEIDNSALGLKLDYTSGAATWTLAWHDVRGDAMRSDWGGYPGYNSMIVRDFNRADETSWRFGLKYLFGPVGFGKLSLTSHYIIGNTPERGPRRSPDETELDFTVDYDIENRFLRHCNLRLRYARVRQDFLQGDGEIDDLRFIVNYELPLF